MSTWDGRFVAAIRRHYTGSLGPPPGKKIAHRIYINNDPVGYIGLGEPAYKLSPRRLLGLSDARPLPKTVCNFIYRIEIPPEAYDIRSSDILRAWHRAATKTWLMLYGWEPVHWETLVDATKVASSIPGACFRRAGYRSLGYTTGRGARRPAGSTHGPRVWGSTTPKLVLYRGPLARLSDSA